ncbi:MAG: hypothetical protein JWP42_1722 [Pseudomonas sp.]|nr:hypothetical protein [Pseudomonas sp.]
MDWQALIKTVAPWIGTALGGPLGGLAIEAAANAMGIGEKTTDAVKQALSGVTPEQMLALKQADQAFALQMQALGFKETTDLESIAAGDRASARGMQIANKSFMPAVISAGLLSSFIGMSVALLYIPIPTSNRDMIIYMIGQLSGFAGSAVAFWLGTTRQSEDKTRMLAQAGPIRQP